MDQKPYCNLGNGKIYDLNDTMRLSCQIVPPPIHYDILIGCHLFDEIIQFTKSISDQTLYLTIEELQPLLPRHLEKVFVLPSSETIKSRAMKEKIENFLFEQRYGKKACLIAIGGGTLLDLVGFIAATYCRGIPHVFVPTTLLSMTDAAIGGKNGVNLLAAKNWIGTFHHPQKVFIDLNFLKTLPQFDFLQGLVETIKHALIADAKLFEFLEKHLPSIIAKDFVLLKEMIFRSCQVKKDVVEKDPFEKKGYRHILNFGHTVGHAIESFSNYKCPHGQAVAMGMLVEAHIACQMGYLSLSVLQRIQKMIDSLKLQKDFLFDLPFEFLNYDKKGKYNFVVLNEIGSTVKFEERYVTSFSREHFEKAWKAMI